MALESVVCIPPPVQAHSLLNSRSDPIKGFETLPYVDSIDLLLEQIV
jgi:hypothetical protein